MTRDDHRSIVHAPRAPHAMCIPGRARRRVFRRAPAPWPARCNANESRSRSEVSSYRPHELFELVAAERLQVCASCTVYAMRKPHRARLRHSCGSYVAPLASRCGPKHLGSRFAFAWFEKDDEADAALAYLREVTVCGRPLRVERARGGRRS